MNNIEELKPCPFCGGDANLLTSRVGFLVECSDCWTSFLNGPVGVGWYRCKDEAAVAWNTSTFEDIYSAIEAGKIPGVVIEKKRRKIKVTFDKVFCEDEGYSTLQYSITINGEIVVNDLIQGKISAPYIKIYNEEFTDTGGLICVNAVYSAGAPLTCKAEWVD